MSTKSTNNTLKFLTLVLALLLVSLGVYTYKFYNEVKDNEAQLIKEKELILVELDEEIGRYNLVLKEKSQLNDRLELAKTELLSLQEKFKQQEVTRAVVQEYQIELRKLRKERELLFRQNDSLLRETQRLSQLQEETQQELNRVQQRQDSLFSSNENLSNRIAKGAEITVGNMLVRAVIQRNSGRFIPTVRAGRAQMLQVKYTVNPNALAEEGDLKFYTQVIGPKGKIIGTPRQVTFEDGSGLSYSNRTIVPYTGETRGISELILPIGSFEKGEYQISVFQNKRKVLSGALTLK